MFAVGAWYASRPSCTVPCDAVSLERAIATSEETLRFAAEQSDFGMNPARPYDVLVYVDAYSHLRWEVVEHIKRQRVQK